MDSPVYANLPALLPPNGVEPNFVDPYSDAYMARILGIALLVLATMAVAARIFTKLRIVRKVDPEDYVLIVAWIGFVVHQAFVLVSLCISGRHRWDVSLPQMSFFIWCEDVIQIVYCPLIVFAKMAVLLQLQRIFAPMRKGAVYWTLVVLQVLNALYYTAGLVQSAFPCNPREKLWNVLTPGTCINYLASVLTSAVFNLCFDIAMLLVPLLAIVRLQMAPTRRAGISGTFAVGILGCISSGFRVYYDAIYMINPDTMWLQVKHNITGAAEITSVSLIVCFPSTPRSYQYLRKKLVKPERASSDQYPRRRLLPVLREAMSGEKEGSSAATEEKSTYENAAPPNLAVPPPTLKSAWLSLSGSTVNDGQEVGLGERLNSPNFIEICKK